jgi:hypothetical protein
MEDSDNPAFHTLMRSGPIKLVNEMTGTVKSTDENVELRLLELYSNLVSDMTFFAEETESEVSRLQGLVRHADNNLQQELDVHQEKVDLISTTIEQTIDNFKRASDSAVRIGERLSTSESERKRLVRAIELMRCVKVFEQADPSEFASAGGLNNDELIEILPEQLREKNWGEISFVRGLIEQCLLLCLIMVFVLQLLMALRKIVSDVNSDQVSNAKV